jgi:hypothetical protein
VASGASILTGDAKYSARRLEKLRETKAAHGGVLSGFVAGSESVVTGFASGITGLVT